MITIKFSCEGCGVHRHEFQIPARKTPDTDVVHWVGQVVGRHVADEQAAKRVLIDSEEAVELRMAIGLLTTTHPTLEVNPRKPMAMAQEICRHVGTVQNRVFDLEDTIRRVENACVHLHQTNKRAGKLKCVQVIREALKKRTN